MTDFTAQINKKKNEISDVVHNDPYFMYLINDGYIQDFIVDKNSYEISQQPEDKEYFLIFVTTIPIGDQRINYVKDEAISIVNKYFTINNPVDIDTESDTYWISVPILYM